MPPIEVTLKVRQLVDLAAFPSSCPRSPLQDLFTNFVKGKFDEKRGLWLVKYKELSRAYTSKWFWIDLVGATGSTV